MNNPRTGMLENIAHLQNEPNLEYIDHDVSGYINVPGELDEIYHFASPASFKDFRRIPIPILKAGALGTYDTLGAALAKGARFMLASSSKVYGDLLVHHQPEDYSKRGRPDMTRAIETLGWKRRVPAREGLRRPLNRLFAGRSERGVS